MFLPWREKRCCRVSQDVLRARQPDIPGLGVWEARRESRVLFKSAARRQEERRRHTWAAASVSFRSSVATSRAAEGPGPPLPTPKAAPAGIAAAAIHANTVEVTGALVLLWFHPEETLEWMNTWSKKTNLAFSWLDPLILENIFQVLNYDSKGCLKRVSIEKRADQKSILT